MGKVNSMKRQIENLLLTRTMDMIVVLIGALVSVLVALLGAWLAINNTIAGSGNVLLLNVAACALWFCAAFLGFMTAWLYRTVR